MKIVIVGGGAHRAFGILRSALAVPGVMDGGEIDLFDLNQARAEAVGRMLLKTPEFKAVNCTIKWSATLEEALVGADVVGVIMPAMTARFSMMANGICHRHGFISSDNVSPTGALCAVRIAPVLLEIARKMEALCPKAWLVDFVNPVAVISGIINNHTKIRALGVCQGFTNHLWDISRIFGKDEEAKELEVTAAGINHLSYILKGTWKGEDLFTALQTHLANDWQPPKLQPWWGGAEPNIQRSVSRLVKFWKELGVLIFSTEGDGMAHLRYEEDVAESRAEHREPSREELAAHIKRQGEGRAEADRTFEAWLDRDLTEDFWTNHWKEDSRFGRVDEDIFVRIFSALAGVKEARIVTSRLNQGAIAGIKDREVVEYTQRLFKDEITHEGPYDIPEVVQGLTAGLAAHQTLLGDALAAQDPEMVARALISYPMNPYSTSSRAVFRELIEAAGEDIRPEFRRAVEFLQAAKI